MPRFKIFSPKGVMHWVYKETRQEAIEHVAELEKATNPEDYHNFDLLVQKFDLIPTPQTLYEDEPEPKPATGMLKVLEDRKIVKTKKHHTPESLAMSIDITKLIDKYKRYGYTQYEIEDLTIMIDQYLKIRPI
jgi:hypothetical protein